MEKKGVEQKQKKKQIKKQSGLLFLWLRCVLLGWPVFLFPSMAIFLFLPMARQLIDGNAVWVGSSGQTRIRSPD